jgi:hypothetical protein
VASVKVVSEKKKFDGKVLRIADCVVGDEKGCVKLTAKDAHIDIVSEGDTITLMNAHVRVNQNYLKIELDKWSLVKKAKEEDTLTCEVNTEINVSDVEYELVQKGDGSKKNKNNYELDSDEEDLSE